MKWGVPACAGVFLALCGPAQAEVGKASASPGEWFLGFAAGGGWASGPERQAFQEIGVAPGDLLADLGDVNFDEGAFFSLGLQAGYVLEQPLPLLDRIELSADLRMLSRDMTPEPEGAALVIAEGLSLIISALPSPDLGIDASDDERDVDLRLSFKKNVVDNEAHIVVASLEPFLRFQDTDGSVAISFEEGATTRLDDISAEYYGLQAALEIESPLTQTMSLIGRASAGGYHVDADIDSRLKSSSGSAGSPASDSASAWGGRLGGALGVKVPLHYAGASLTLMGTIDYLTDVATIDHARLAEGVAPEVTGRTEAGFDDALDLGGRVELVFPLR